MTRMPRSNRRSLLVLGLFSYLWVVVGVALSTLTVVGPARWITERAGWTGWTYGLLTAGLLVLALFLLSLAITRWLLRRTLLSRKGIVRAGIPVAVTIVAVIGVWLWLTAPVPGADIALAGIHGDLA